MLKVNETFYSLQGEGLYSGMASFFIRLTGCNLACTWCDTTYASRGTASREMSIGDLLEEVERCPESAHVVLTGGEPMLQAAVPELCEALHRVGRRVTIETNGSLPPGRVQVALASLSPKLPGSQPDGSGALDLDVVSEWIRMGSYQLKFVVRTVADIEAAVCFLDQLSVQWEPARVFMMPEGRDAESVARHTAVVVEECRRRGLRYGRRLQLDLFGDQRGT
jgi:7-carboxy-7-deazaguanine synthase